MRVMADSHDALSGAWDLDTVQQFALCGSFCITTLNQSSDDVSEFDTLLQWCRGTIC